MNRNTPADAGFITSATSASLAFTAGIAPLDNATGFIIAFILGAPAIAGIILGIIGCRQPQHRTLAVWAIILGATTFLAFLLGSLLGALLFGT